jgi:hypothetical protein
MEARRLDDIALRRSPPFVVDARIPPLLPYPQAENLPVVPDAPRISSDPKTWKCAASGMATNLWLNLSTGYIGGGRRNHDGRSTSFPFCAVSSFVASALTFTRL